MYSIEEECWETDKAKSSWKNNTVEKRPRLESEAFTFSLKIREKRDKNTRYTHTRTQIASERQKEKNQTVKVAPQK